MAGSLSDFAEAQILNFIAGGSPLTIPTNWYVGYMVGMPGESGPGAEPNFGGYARVAVGNNTQNFPIVSNQIKQNASEIAFGEASANHGTVQAIGFWDSPASGNMYAYLPLATPISISAGDAMKIPIGSITVQFATGGLSNYLKNGILNALFGNVPLNLPTTLYFSLSTSTPSDALPGTEPSGGSYTRVAVSNTSNNFPPTSTGIKLNATDISFAEATGSWGSATHVQIFDAVSGGNYLGRYALASAQGITAGTIPVIPANSLTFTLD